MPLPSGLGGETKFATYLGFTYGGKMPKDYLPNYKITPRSIASVLNSEGRCGLNANMERALNETMYVQLAAGAHPPSLLFERDEFAPTSVSDGGRRPTGIINLTPRFTKGPEFCSGGVYMQSPMRSS